jgi:endonuclease/exonuclease/phosphatase family metal-dependent hydrolase
MTLYFRGKPTCECLYESLPLVEKVMLKKGLIKYNLDVYQIIGGAVSSAGTHSTGGAVDTAQAFDAQLRVWRDAGYDAGWRRTTQQGFDIWHCHAVARGCPHNSPARYQISAVDDGYNGLGYNGHGGLDDGPRPLSHRTWQEGITWMKAYLAEPVTPPPAPTIIKHMNWNVGSPKFFGPWEPRRDGFAMVFGAWKPDVLVCQETHYSYQTTDILNWLGKDDYIHHSSPVGNDIFRKGDTTDMGSPPFKEYSLGVQNRWAGVLHLTSNGHPFVVIASHFPALVPYYRTIAAKRFVTLYNQVTGGPRIVSADMNNESKDASPHKELQAAGLTGIKDQCAVVNESQPEFPSKDKWLADVMTKVREAQIKSGQLILTSARLSDHRPIWARIQIAS